MEADVMLNCIKNGKVRRKHTEKGNKWHVGGRGWQGSHLNDMTDPEAT